MGETVGNLPSGTVTLLLADIEGSTSLWERRGEEMAEAVAELDELVTKTVATNDGARPVEQGEGDSFVAGFARASDAVACALALQQATLAGGFLRLRMGINTGEVQLRDPGNYMGPAINRAARLRDAGHGGQVLLTQTAADLARTHLPETASLRRLGELALRGLDEPEHVFQLDHPDLPASFAPLRATDAPRTNLPVQLTSFIGRVEEIGQVGELLDTARMVTLTGSGGAGKTRLAVEVATRRCDLHPGGLWFVDLSRYNEASAALAGVAEAVGLARTTGLTVEVIARYLCESTALVVLDNCEHLIAFAASVADALLRGCPNLSILATSREPLGVAGETTFRVPSLVAPEGDDLPVKAVASFDAVALFVERARRAQPDFALDATTAPVVVDICRRVEGLPLAIELAAARLRALSPQQILDGLRNRFRMLTGGARTTVARQQTLQASVDWSYGLLLDVERTVLNRLSVFAGGFTMGAAEAVCAGGPVEPHHVFDIVLHLVDKSLVNADGDRFHLLETVRQYAAIRLADADEAEAVRARHFEFLYSSVRFRPPMGDTEAGYRRAIESDYENIRRALQWAAEQPDPLLLARFANRLAQYWLTGKRSADGARWHEQVVAEEADPARKGLAMVRLGTLYARSSRYDRDRELVEDGVALLRSSDNRVALATALISSLPDWERLEELEAIATELDHSELKTRALYWRAFLAAWIDPEAAGELAAQALEAARREGIAWIELNAGFILALVPVLLGEVAAAISALEDVLKKARIYGESYAVAAGLSTLATLHELAGDHARSRADLAELEALGEELGGLMTTWFPTLTARCLTSAVRGEWHTALDLLRDQVEGPLREADRAGLLGLMAVIEALAGLHGTAASHAAESDRLAADDGINFLAYVPSDLARALSARAAGDWPRAEEYTHRAMDAARAKSVLPHLRLVIVLLLADVWAARGREEDAARLLAGVRREVDRTGVVWETPLLEAARGDSVEVCRQALGSERFDEVWAEGAAMARDDVVAYAQRGWGPRDRATHGWDALTPTERQVADLVVTGATNREVAEKLFMSVATVKTHLTHVYAKVGVTSRAQLAAEVATLRP